MSSCSSVISSAFLSTPSARRATKGQRFSAVVLDISIHALREEGDMKWNITGGEADEFLSTPSVRRATDHQRVIAAVLAISIHALREEGDEVRLFESYHL